ncbi:hypothetical protein FGG79_02510 [Bacillus sp. BHET2]|uniref:hypothetical protein n=1 Tax=Bacillus sp. BHET2 TaxID=2583818 RepID=UPI00110EB874|nr:hypothetical protein [Bacillus sp. BHET2]TMU87033.1 hypothetical protein FGG79_02510 [Bacillus sp. BHET2]
MKKLSVRSLCSALVIALCVWIASMVFSFSYGEWSFFIGLGLTVVLFFFNSSGGTLSKGATMQASEAGWKIQKDNELKANVGAVFYGSALFTLISFVLMLVTFL